MARVVLTSLGYRGDVFSFVRIASELAARGHEVSYVVPTEFHQILQGQGFRCVGAGFDIGPTVLERHAQLLRHLSGFRLMKFLFAGLIGPHLDEMFEALDAEVASADAVVSHTLSSVVASTACERRGVPMILGDLFPMHMPSAFTAPVGAPNLGQRGNHFVWNAATKMSPRAQPGRKAINAFRHRLGLAPDRWSMLNTGSTHGIGLVSPSYMAAARLAHELPSCRLQLLVWSGRKRPR